MLFAVLVALAILLLGGRAAVTVRDADIVDFRCFWEAGRLVATGGDPYDRTAWANAVYTDPERVPHCAKTFIYPLWTAAAMAPLSALDERAALAVWEVLLLLSTLGAVALFARTWSMVGGARPLLLLLLWSQPTFSAIGNAQFGPLILLAVAALAYGLARAGARAPAIGWLLLLLKPHITALVMLGSLIAMPRRLAAAVLGGAALIAAASVAVRPSWPFDLVRENFAGQQLLGDRGLGTLWTLAADLGLPATLGGAVAVLLAAVVFALARPRGLEARGLIAALVAASFVLTPYARPHDLVILAVCWAAALARAKVADPSERSALLATTIVVALILPWAVTLLSLFGAPLSLYVLVSLATAALTVVVLRAPSRTAPQPLG